MMDYTHCGSQMIENHLMDRLVKDVLMIELGMHTEKNDTVFHTEKTRMVILVVEIDVGGAMEILSNNHGHAVKRIFRYLKGKPHLYLWYPKDSPFDLVDYSDNDYAGASLDRKSITRGCQFLGCRLISWQCKKQIVMDTSSTETEYVSAASCCLEHIPYEALRMIDYRLVKDVLMMELVMHTEKSDTMFYTKKTCMLMLVVEINVGGMTVDVVDKLTCSSDDVQPRQVDLSQLEWLLLLIIQSIYLIGSLHSLELMARGVDRSQQILESSVHVTVIATSLTEAEYVVDASCCAQVKENQEKDKIGSKPDKNGKRGKAGKSQNQLQLKEEEKPKKTKKEWPKTHTHLIPGYGWLCRNYKEAFGLAAVTLGVCLDSGLAVVMGVWLLLVSFRIRL
nr:uncharacterized mitochondrial protein AtMg00810-like [Tanacetum cinerariifolium]